MSSWCLFCMYDCDAVELKQRQNKVCVRVREREEGDRERAGAVYVTVSLNVRASFLQWLHLLWAAGHIHTRKHIHTNTQTQECARA